ncbi:MAG: riboflavin synthase [Pseudomonadota bacterium]
MFTGIIQTLGSVKGIQPRGDDCQLQIDVGGLSLADIALGDSIAVNGVCLTAVAFGENHFFADVSVETLQLTTIGDLQTGDRVNLELALTPVSRLGGHLVSGHVDGIGEVLSRRPDARSERYSIRVPNSLSHYVAPKGSICVDGISLTVNSIESDVFSVNIVPHTQERTTLGDRAVGDKVNIEIDLLARYLERLLHRQESWPGEGGITETLLRESGFIKAGD